jgi:N-terminal domain of (some) glycogen debranching enzymes
MVGRGPIAHLLCAKRVGLNNQPRPAHALCADSPDVLFAWKGPSLLIVSPRGECGSDKPLTGYYFREARFLRTLALEIDGERPWPCEAAINSPTDLAFAFTYPEIAEYGWSGSSQLPYPVPTNQRGIPQRGLAIRLLYSVRLDGLRIDLHIGNHTRKRIDCELAWSLDADFADIQEAQSDKREQQGDVATETRSTGIRFEYQHARLRYRSAIDVTPADGWSIAASRIGRRVELPSQASLRLGLMIVPSAADGTRVDEAIDDREEALRGWRERFARVTVPRNRTAELLIAKNVRDFASFPLLEGERDEWLVLQAGMPLYPALFGRDTLTAGWQAAWVDQGQSLEASLTRLGRLQSDRVDEWRDEEPGRIPYQVRRGPLALLDINPYSAYYADYASPFIFVIALAHLYTHLLVVSPALPLWLPELVVHGLRLAGCEGDGAFLARRRRTIACGTRGVPRHVPAPPAAAARVAHGRRRRSVQSTVGYGQEVGLSPGGSTDRPPGPRRLRRSPTAV